MTYKPRVFIGSSSERINVLTKIIDYLKDVADCIPWMSAFGQNKSGLDSLVKQTKVSDFAILIAMKDDLTLKRDEVESVPRDNIIFEFGLFLGATGVEKVYLLAEDGINLPTDLDGITLFKFTEEEGKYNSLNKICENIIENILRASTVSELGLLPSTALAIGYYSNFIKGVCEEIHKNECIYTENKEIKVRNFRINILIPKTLDDSGVRDFTTLYNKKHSLSKASTIAESNSTARTRGYPFHFRVEASEQETETDIHLFDIPSTLNTIVESIKLFMPTMVVGVNDDTDYLSARELKNFANVLRYLIEKNVATKHFVTVHEEVEL